MVYLFSSFRSLSCLSDSQVDDIFASCKHIFLQFIILNCLQSSLPVLILQLFLKRSCTKGSLQCGCQGRETLQLQAMLTGKELPGTPNLAVAGLELPAVEYWIQKFLDPARSNQFEMQEVRQCQQTWFRGWVVQGATYQQELMGRIKNFWARCRLLASYYG